jgi:glycine/sarcosine N-methyltransferase
MYEHLAPYYEELFPASDTSVDFLSQRCRDGGRILDVACGTGEHARKLARLGYRVTGIDLDGRMIFLARERGGGVEYHVADMTDLAATLGTGERFDLVSCIGNSLVHLPDRAAVASFLRGTASLLSAGGGVVLQIINFESLRSGNLPEFADLTSSDGRILFSRRYEVKDGDHVSFVTSLSVDGVTGADESIELLVLTKDELTAMLADASFVESEAFGGFDGTPWRDDAFVTIVRARKP